MWRLSWVCVALGFSLCLLARTAVAVTDPSSGPAEGSGGRFSQTAASPDLYLIVPGINDHGVGMLKGVVGGPDAPWPAMARPGSVVVSVVEATWKEGGLSEQDVALAVREEVAAALKEAEASGTDVVVLVDMDLEDYSVVRELPLPEALNRWHPSTAWAGTMITAIAEEFTLRTPGGYRWLGGHSAGVDAIRMHLRASPDAMFDRVDVFNGRTPWQELRAEVQADGYSPSRFFVWTNSGDLPAMPRSLSYAAGARQGSDAWTHLHAESLSGANLRVVSVPNHSVLLTNFGLQGDLVVSMNGQVVGQVDAAPRQIIPGSAELPTRTSAPLGVIVGGGLPALGEGWETSGPDDEGWALIKRGDWTEWKHVLCATDPPEVAAAKVKRRALMMGQGPGSPVVVAGDPESEEVQAVVAALLKVGYSEEDIVKVDTGGLSRQEALRKTALEMHRVGATTGVMAPGQRAAAADLLSTDPDDPLVRTLLAADWAAMLAILDAKKDEDLSPIERFIKGHACLAVNRNNESTLLFWQPPADSVRQWAAWTRGLVQSDEGSSVAHQLHGDALARQGMLDEALAELGRALDLQPENVLALNERGVIHAMSGEWQSAAHDLRSAMAIAPDLADLYASFGAMYVQRQDGVRGALEAFGRALDINGDFVVARYGRACVYLASGDFEKARADIEAMVPEEGPLRAYAALKAADLATATDRQVASLDTVASLAGSNPQMRVDLYLDELQRGNAGLFNWNIHGIGDQLALHPELSPYVEQRLQDVVTAHPELAPHLAGEQRLREFTSALKSFAGGALADISLSLGPLDMNTQGLSRELQRGAELDMLAASGIGGFGGRPPASGFKTTPAEAAWDTGSWPVTPEYGLLLRPEPEPAAVSQSGADH